MQFFLQIITFIGVDVLVLCLVLCQWVRVNGVEFCAGRIWAGHNIIRFDCVRIRDAFAAIKQPPPEPKGLIDSLVLLTQKFGRRAGNMKVSFSTYACSYMLITFIGHLKLN